MDEDRSTQYSGMLPPYEWLSGTQACHVIKIGLLQLLLD